MDPIRNTFKTGVLWPNGQSVFKKQEFSDRHYIDFNSLLIGANFIVMCLIIVVFSMTQGNEYINQQTIIIGILLSIQTHIALLFERKQRDPFVTLLAFTMIFYFSLRIITLTLYPYSVVFERYPFGADDSNYALIFIILANIFLYAGLYIVKFNNKLTIDSDNWRPASVGMAACLALASIIFRYTQENYWSEYVPRVFNFLLLIFNNSIIMLMAYTYFFVLNRSSGRRFSLVFMGLILIDALLHSIGGSRAAIVNIILNFGLVVLGINSYVKFKKKYFYFGLALLPVFVVIVFGGFIASSVIRAQRGAESSFNLVRNIEFAKQSFSELSSESKLDDVLPPIFDRLGSFDYSAEIIAHKEQYDKVINISSYTKSIIDNLLTPGFDIYDQPKISNSLRFIYSGDGPPMKSRAEESYQSDQLGLYGELYALLEYGSLPLFFLIAFLIKLIYAGLRGSNPFNLAMKRVIVLYVFSMIINSFGFDWTIIETLPFIAAMFIYTFFFQVNFSNDSHS